MKWGYNWIVKHLILQIIPNTPRVNIKVLDKLSDIFIGIGHLMIGSIALPFLIDKFDTNFILIGVLSALVCWGMSIFLILEQ